MKSRPSVRWPETTRPRTTSRGGGLERGTAVARKKKRAPMASASEALGKRSKAGQARPPAARSSKGSSPRKLYSPGEIVRHSGISRQVLHNYTVLGLLVPAEVTPTNRRYYDERVFGRIELIQRMLASGYRLGDLRETFRWED